MAQPPSEPNSGDDAYTEVHFAVFAALSQLAPAILREVQQKIQSWLGRSVTEDQIRTIIDYARHDLARSLCGMKHHEMTMSMQPYAGGAARFVGNQNFSYASSTIGNRLSAPVPTNLSYDVPLESVSVVGEQYMPDAPYDRLHVFGEERRGDQQEILEEEKNPATEGHDASDSDRVESPEKASVREPVDDAVDSADDKIEEIETEEDTVSTVRAAPVARISDEPLSYSEPHRFSEYDVFEQERASVAEEINTVEPAVALEEGGFEREVKEKEQIRMDGGDHASPKTPPFASSPTTSHHDYPRQFGFGSPVPKNVTCVTSEEESLPEKPVLFGGAFPSPFGGVLLRNQYREEPPAPATPEKTVVARVQGFVPDEAAPRVLDEPEAAPEEEQKPVNVVEQVNVANTTIPSTPSGSYNSGQLYERAVSCASDASNATFDVDEGASYLRRNSLHSERVPSHLDSSSSDQLIGSVESDRNVVVDESDNHIVSEQTVSNVIAQSTAIAEPKRPKKLLAPHRSSVVRKPTAAPPVVRKTAVPSVVKKSTGPSVAQKPTALPTVVPREHIERVPAVKRESFATFGDEPLPWSPPFIDASEAYNVRITQATDPSDFHVAIYEPGSRYDVEGKLKQWWKSAKKAEFTIKPQDLVDNMPVGIVRSPSVVVRGVVTHMVTPHTAEVRLIDHGTAEVVAVTKLVRLPKRLMTDDFMALAVPCRVEIDTNKYTADGRPLWPHQVMNSMKKAVEERRVYQAYFYEVIQDKYVVNLYIPKYGADESKSLLTHVKKYLAMWDSGPKSPTGSVASMASIFGASTTCASELEMSVDSDGTLEPQRVSSDSDSTLGDVDLDIETVN